MDGDTPEVMADILMLCKAHPDLCPYAERRLSDICQRFAADPPASLRPSIKQLVHDFLSSQKKEKEQPVKLTSVNFRDICRALARKHNLDFDPKVTKKKEDLFQWCEACRPVIHKEFFVLLGDLVARGGSAARLSGH